MKAAEKQAIPYKYSKHNADIFTPVELFTKLSGKKKCLLESSFKHEKKGRYSYIAADPYREFKGSDNITTDVNHSTGTETAVQQHLLAYLQEQLPKLEMDLPLPFYGGAIGYIGYDVIRQFEDIGGELPDELDMPDAHLMMYRNIIVYDHAKEILYFICMNPDGEEDSVLEERLRKLEQTLYKKSEKMQETTGSVHFQPEITEEQFKHKVETAKAHIRQGDIFQVVLSQRMTAAFEGDPFTFYRKLRKANPSPYMFYIDFDEYVVLGASPESLVETHGKEVVTNPIAGTRPRGRTAEEDEVLAKELLTDEKEIAEHRMLVDLSRNDLGCVCEIGSIHLPVYMNIEKYQHVMHIVSETAGVLREDVTGIDALRACLPAGTVSGAPKIRAMQIINDLEEKKRGVYAGGVGFINFRHDVTIALAIRSLAIKENRAYLQTGAGIVYDSLPETEYQETLNKAKALMEVNAIDFAD